MASSKPTTRMPSRSPGPNLRCTKNASNHVSPISDSELIPNIDQMYDGFLFETRCTQQFTLKRELEKRLDGQVTGSTSCNAHEGKTRSVFCSGSTSTKLASLSIVLQE